METLIRHPQMPSYSLRTSTGQAPPVRVRIQIQCHREIDKGAFQRLAVTFGFSLVGIAGYLNRITDPYDPRANG